MRRVLALTAVAALGLIVAPAAQAAKIADRVLAGGTTAGSAAGQLNNPTGVAINDPTIADATTDPLGASTNGYVYVAERTNHRVQVFDANGAFKFMFGKGVNTGTGNPNVCTSAGAPTDICGAGSTGGGVGEFNSPAGVAINQQTGDLYVTDTTNRRIQQFSANGTFIRTWGWGVDDGSGVFQVCDAPVDLPCQAGISGANGGQFVFQSGIQELEVDPAPPHNLFVADSQNRRLSEFSASGNFIRLWGWDVVPSEKPGNLGVTFEICSSVVAEACKAGLASAGPPGDGNFLNGHPITLAVDGPTGTVYASEQRGGIQRFDSDEAAPAAVAKPRLTSENSPLISIFGGGVLEVEPLTSRLLAVRGSTAVQALDVSIEPPTEAARHLEGAGLTPQGLDVNPASGNFYFSGGGHRLFLADEDGAVPAITTINPATDVQAGSAKLSGTVNPNDANFAVSYRFQVSVEDGPWKDVGSPVNLGTGNTPVAVEVEATNLEANAPYEARIATKKAFGNPDRFSAETSFQTDPAPPEAETRQPQSFTDVSARLAAEINPNRTATSYRFEYGTTTGYGSEITGNMGAGGLTELVIEEITGLEPETIYHYRVVADNGVGSPVVGDDQSFTTRSPFRGFPERAYEQVTPATKSTDPLTFPSAFIENGRTNLEQNSVTADGSGFTFRTFEPLFSSDFGSPIPTMSGLGYAARRVGDAWVTTSPPRTKGGGSFPLFGTIGGPGLSTGLLATTSGWHYEPGSPSGYYRHDFQSGTNTLLWPLATTIGGVLIDSERLQYGTADGNHLVFNNPLVLDDAPGIPGTSVTKLYEWVAPESGEGDPSIRLVQVDEAGTAFAGSAVAGGGPNDLSRSLSSDGRHIFFSIGGEIYRRSDGETTAIATASKRTPPDPLGVKPKSYRTASTDGDRVFFTSAEHLTDDANTGPARAGNDLYRYEFSTDTLIDVSAEFNTANGARVQGILGASDDGGWIYYVALGRVIAGKGVDGQRNLYAWHDDGSADGETRFIATLAGGDSCSSNNPVPESCNYADESSRTGRVSKDGKVAAFHSAANLTSDPAGNGEMRVYVYEADADGGAGVITCASCRPDGQPAEGRSLLRAGSGPLADGERLSRTLSDDGSRLFFTSADAILPADTNDAVDVYMWEAGRVILISSGKSPHDTAFGGASASGDDAFFFTREKLVGQDFDGLYDVYDYRVGGGLPSQHPVPPGEPCASTDACKGEAHPPSSQAGPGSSASTPGNLKAKDCSQLQKKVKRAQRKARKARKARSSADPSAELRKAQRQLRRCKGGVR